MDEKKKKLIKMLLIGLGGLIVLLLGLLLLIPREPKNVELTFWGFWEEEDAMHPIIEKYEAENPGVKITYAIQQLSNYESLLYTRLEQAQSTNEPAPDIAMIHNSWLPKFEKYLTPLPSTVMSLQTYAEEFYPTALEDFTGKKGDIYAIPLQIDGLMVIYNKDLLAKAGYSTPPADWDSFMDAAKKMTKTDSRGIITQAGLAVGTAENITHSTDILLYFFLQNLAPIIGEDKTVVNLTSPRAVTAFEEYTSFAKDEDATWASYLANDVTHFVRGELAMMFGTSWRALEILERTEDIDFGLAPLPRLTNNEEAYLSSYWGTSVSNTCRNSKEAWEFVEYLSQPEQLRRLYQNASKVRAFGEPYSRVSMNSELAQNVYTSALAYMAPYMKSWQFGEQTFVENKLKEAITTQNDENYQSGESILRKAEQEINLQLAVSNK
jgi:multiple sugar transport system substrate-binding protein